MKPRRERYIARLEEVSITRDGDAAIIEYREPDIPTTHLRIGSEIAWISDEAILKIFNETLRAQAKLAAEYKHVAIEVPIGSRQIDYNERCHQWASRGGVLRCVVGDDEEGQVVVGIDNNELSLQEFGRMLTTYAGLSLIHI